MEPSESGPHASRGGDEGDDSLDFDSLHSGDFFDAIRSSPRSPRSGAPDGSLRRGASADLRGLSDTLDGDSLPEKPFGFRAESSQSFMTDDLLLFEDYLDVLPDSAEAGADAEVDVDDGEGAGEEGNENSDLDLEKVTHEDVEKLRDFSEELGSSYYKDYKNWRMGGARGAKGEAQDALQEHQSRDGDTEAESELVINTLEDEWASLYMIPGLDDVLHKERTLEEKDDQGLAPLRSKVKRTRVVYEESPQDDAAHDDEEDASLQEKLRHKARKREPKNLANAEQVSDGPTAKQEVDRSGEEEASLARRQKLSQFERGYMAGLIAAQRVQGALPPEEPMRFLAPRETNVQKPVFSESAFGEKAAASDPVNDLGHASSTDARPRRAAATQDGKLEAKVATRDGARPFIRNPPYTSAFSGALSSPTFLNTVINLKIGTEMAFRMQTGGDGLGLPTHFAPFAGIGAPFGTMPGGEAAARLQVPTEPLAPSHSANVTFNLGDNRLSSAPSSRRAACRQPGCDKKAVSSGLCVRHGGGRRCGREGCMNIAASRSTFCKTHGGGRRCQFEGCDKSAAVPTDFCKRHGGGKRCQAEGCTKSAQGSTNYCKGHGGGRRCLYEGCLKSAADSTEFCKRHGGGVRCTHPGCDRAGADGRTLCKRHGGGRRCSIIGCAKSSQGNTGLCRRHFVSLAGAEVAPS